MPASGMTIPASYPASVLGRRFSYEGKVYLADTIGMRWISDIAVYDALFSDWNGITALHNPAGGPTSIDGVGAYIQTGTPDYKLFMFAPTAPAIPAGAALVTDPSAPEIYLTEGNVKRHIVSPDVMNQFYFSWNAVQRVTTAEIASLTAGSDVSATPVARTSGATPMYSELVHYEPSYLDLAL